jgi:hypothetical protein
MCGTEKPLDDFHRSARRGRQAWCKDCRRAYDHEYHLSRRELRLAQKRERRRETRSWYQTLKEDKPCADCGGVFHQAAMTWDHRPGTVKRCEVSMMVRGFSRQAILDEIAKCDLVCANCHAARTAERRGA